MKESVSSRPCNDLACVLGSLSAVHVNPIHNLYKHRRGGIRLDINGAVAPRVYTCLFAYRYYFHYQRPRFRPSKHSAIKPRSIIDNVRLLDVEVSFFNHTLPRHFSTLIRVPDFVPNIYSHSPQACLELVDRRLRNPAYSRESHGALAP